MKYKKTVLLAITLALASVMTQAQDNLSALLPMPKKAICTDSNKCFDMRYATVTRNDCSTAPHIAEELSKIIERHTGIEIDNNNKKKSVNNDNCPSVTHFQSPLVLLSFSVINTLLDYFM